jgi:hypothetical protein
MMCSICNDKPATNKCNICEDVFCDKCAGLHLKTFSDDGFRKTTFTELRNAPDNKL